MTCDGSLRSRVRTSFRDPAPHDGGVSRMATTFAFLGFTHVWVRTQKGKAMVRQQTATSRLARAINASYHHSKLLAPLLKRYRKVLTLLYLRPYSPELNPIERVWKLTRRLCTHNQYFATLESLVTTVTDQMTSWAEPNPTLLRLCCNI